MLPDEFERLGRQIHGGRHGWIKALAVKLERHQSTISQYSTGALPIPAVVALAVRQLAAEAER